MASNTAAWITGPKARPLEVKPSSLGVPGEGQILVKNRAVAVNPIDGKLQSFAIYPLEYPTILGLDVAGEVAAVGPGVTSFAVGDRVAGFISGFAAKHEEKGFQAYSILNTTLTSKVPDHLPFEEAVVFPLGFSTAASGLFNEDHLNLQLPTEPRRESTGQTLLVWGGATSVGSNAIQLAVAAGYEVVSTASPANFDFVKGLGAAKVFDYKSPTVVADLVAALKGKDLVGAFDANGGAAWEPTMEVVQKAGAKLVTTVIPGFPDAPEGVSIKQTFANSITSNHVAKACWQDFLPNALAAGSFKPAPAPLVAGHGLESIQGALDILMGGVSAQKVVVTL
ncbi:Zinc-binding alcohol dehydrogenase domain-containing protein cipB [Paramyrothecium foliicola]|nr:Zinc-binding alcohol dehydrogenase domain-containing protein cipB [Paramyrothecium foliicola]